MPVTEVTLLAATLFHDTRCCIAGIDSEGNWVRPGFQGAKLGTYPAARLVLPTHLWGQEGFFGTSLSVLRMGLELPGRLTRPHVEDRELSTLPRFVRALTKDKERIHFLDERTENGAVPEVDDREALAEGLAAQGRSLILVGPVRLSEVTFGDLPGKAGRIKYRVKVSFKLPRQRSEVTVSSTDLSWRAIGRSLGAGQEVVELSGADLCDRLHVRHDVYVTLGLTRGDPDAIAAGIHTVPGLFEIDTDSGPARIRVQQNSL
jgi:hypothetical protein